MIWCTDEERHQILKEYSINQRDIFIFKWRIPQVLCEAPPNWGGLLDPELTFRAALKAYENQELQQDFLKGKPNNVYKAIMDEVMGDLVERRVAAGDDVAIPYAEIEMCRYRKGRALTANNNLVDRK